MDTLARMGLDIERLVTFVSSLGWPTLIKILIEVLIIVYAIVWIWGRIRGTQAERLVKGVMILVLVCIGSSFLGFTLITNILQQFIPVAVLALLIVFQPEVRRGLGYLGRAKTFKIDLSLTDTQKERYQQVIEQLIVASRELSRTKTGALIVIEPPEGERDYLSPGVTLNAEISSNLLLSIFFPNSPLHDGAVIIRKDKIVAAGVILPITDNQKLSYRYGTRHRAAIGLSEIYDGLCIVVSEETGSISAANRGMLVRYNSADDLADPLLYLYSQGGDAKTPNSLQAFLALFGRSKRPTGQDTSLEQAYTSPKDNINPNSDITTNNNLMSAADVSSSPMATAQDALSPGPE